MATEADKVNTGALATIAAVLGFSVLGIAFAVTALVRNEEEALVDNRSAGARRPYDQMHAEQQGSLAQGSMPIETAMAKVVEGLKADPQSATPPSPVKEDAGTTATETTDAGTEATDAAAEEADGAATEGVSDAAPEKTEEPVPTDVEDAAAPKKKPKPKGGATPPTPPSPPPPTLPTPTAP